MGQHIAQRLAELDIQLDVPVPVAGARFVPAVQVGSLLFVSGHIAAKSDILVYPGKLGQDVTLEQGYAAARQSAIALLGTVQAALGDLDRVKRIVKLLGMVNSTPDFTGQSQVINGASDLLIAVFGENGRHARSAVGMAQLPLNASVEIEMIVEIESGL